VAEQHTPESSSVAADSELLADVGYLDFAEETAEEGEASGVVRHLPELAAPGLRLVNSIALGRIELLEAEGGLLQSWRTPARTWVSRCELLPTGELLVLGTAKPAADPEARRGFEGREGPGRERAAFLLQLDWDGNELWRRDMTAHHDLRVLEDGRLLTLLRERRELGAESDPSSVLDDSIALLSPAGELLESHSVHALLRAGPERLALEPVPPGAGPESDLLHCNSLLLFEDDELAAQNPLYTRGHALVSVRNQNSLAILDLAAGELVWSWGRDELVLQHEATLLEGGNLLVFDNGDESRPWSRVLELDPRTDQIVWQYTAPDPEDFYSASRGTAQALPGANVLVANSNSGEAFELTRDGEIVWRYRSPHVNERGQRPTIRIRYYPPGYLEAR